jgi:Protein of unknown function (DUF1638)
MNSDRIAIAACGALSSDITAIATANSWPIDVHPLPPLLHNQPQKIAAAVDELVLELQDRYSTIAVGYADCGTYGAVDEVCEKYALPRLGGQHCYDVYAGAKRLAQEFEREPGTYVLTDFLAISFERTVIQELGLDRYPELRDDYFKHYHRVIWLAGRRTRQVETAATAAAERIGLPLEIIDVGLAGLEQELRTLLNSANTGS